jgi:hypothetical protein
MKFVGQLFRVQLLSDKIMHSCVQELFGDPSEPDEEKLACNCTLLTSIGCQLEKAAMADAGTKPEHGKFMKKYFKTLKELGENVKLSSRLRFMCQDLLEMRKNGWNKRREDDQAKTIAEIHEDVEREEGKKPPKSVGAGAVRGGGPTVLSRGTLGSSGGSNGSFGGSAPRPVSNDGWETVQVRKPSSDARRAPAQAPAQASIRGGGGGFSAFNDKEKRERAEKAEKEKQKAEKKEKEEKKAAKAAKKDEEGKRGDAASKEPLEPPEDKSCDLSADAFKQSANAEVEQFLRSGDKQEVAVSLGLLGHATLPLVGAFVASLLEVLCTKYKEKEVVAAAELLVYLVEEGVLGAAGVESGLATFVSTLEVHILPTIFPTKKCLLHSPRTTGLFFFTPSLLHSPRTAVKFSSSWPPNRLSQDFVVDAPKSEAWLCKFIAHLALKGTISLRFFTVSARLSVKHTPLSTGTDPKPLVSCAECCRPV